MSDKICDCPFCGCQNPPVSGWPEMGLGKYRVMCPDVSCGATGPKRDTADKAIAAWNRADRKWIMDLLRDKWPDAWADVLANEGKVKP